MREFEERETAAKSGRPMFLQMLNALKQGKATGVIIHKIDRSARNLRDWAELGEIIDRGIDVHFANENLDLESRGGRLSADIQAVVAADYIRNLREEVKKGFYGRLKQGFYPMPAPPGYLNKGPAQAKEVDPIQGPLVKKTFELYGTGLWGINALVEEMFKAGLRNRSGGKITRNGMSHLLHNYFYTGLIKIKKSNEVFIGQHVPIIPKAMFDRVQNVIAGKNVKGPLRHEFCFRRLMSCGLCHSRLIGEKKKGHVYYRCHNRDCQQKSVREDCVDGALRPVLESLKFADIESQYLQREIVNRYKGVANYREARLQALKLQLEHVKSKQTNLTDAYLEGVLDKCEFTEKKNALLIEEHGLEDRKRNIDRDVEATFKMIQEILGLANSAYLSYKMANPSEKWELLKTITSDISITGKTVLPKLRIPFRIVAERQGALHGRPSRDTNRTLSRLLSQLISYAKSVPDKGDEEVREVPTKITPHRLRLAFRRANSAGPENLAA